MSVISFEFVPESADESQQLVEDLKLIGGVSDVRLESDSDDRFLPAAVVVIVVVGSSGLAALTRIADWLRDRRDCLLVVDARGTTVKVEERCDISGRRGQVIVVTGPDEQVVIHKNEAILDLQAIVTAAIGKSASSVAGLAESAGARAEIEKPRSQL
jgi:hypothetical protein